MYMKCQHERTRPAKSVDGVQMYKFGGAESGPEELRHFSLSGYRQGRPLPVPPEPTLFDTALRALRRNPWTVRAIEVGVTRMPSPHHLSCMAAIGRARTNPEESADTPVLVGYTGSDCGPSFGTCAPARGIPEAGQHSA
jgi:hypothetical protein